MQDDIFTFDDHDPGGKVKLVVPDHVTSSAVFSECNQYRYELHRRWNHDEPVKSIMFLMMNPSTATADIDDPTVRKCRTYAGLWGYNHLIIGNVMAYRATHPEDLLAVYDPQGPANLSSLRRLMTDGSPFLVCAWGRISKKLAWAEDYVLKLIGDFDPHILRLNKSGRPWHPLYLPNDTEPVRWLKLPNT